LDTVKQTLTFENIDFTLDTKNTLKGAAFAYAGWLLNPILTHEFEKRFVVDISPELKSAISDANKLVSQIKLAAPLHLNFNLEQLKIHDIGVYGDRIYVNFDASGTDAVTF
jgi:hypothetical protein